MPTNIRLYAVYLLKGISSKDIHLNKDKSVAPTATAWEPTHMVLKVRELDED